MPTAVRSFAKVNIGLYIGPLRPSGFHELRTIYQTVAISDIVRVTLGNGSGIEVRCKNPGVPEDETNTCWRMADRVLRTCKRRGKVVITIEKHLPVQGGLGAGSSNAIATLFALERELGQPLSPADRFRVALEIGSDLPLFLFGGTVLGIGRGEEVFPLSDLPETPVVVVTPEIGVSTPKAFAAWDDLARRDSQLTGPDGNARINELSHAAFSWLTGSLFAGVPASGATARAQGARGRAANGGDRAEKVVTTPLLDLVRAGIENDFERVVFPLYPELRESKRALERHGAKYASLSGSGSTVYGLFESSADAERAAERLTAEGHRAVATRTLSRAQYWQDLVI